MKKLSRQQWLFVAIALICFALLKAGLIYWYLQQKGQTGTRASTSAAAICSKAVRCRTAAHCALTVCRVHSEAFLITLEQGRQRARPAPSFRWKKWTWASTATALSPQASQWQAKVTLPVCISGSGDWLMDLQQGGHRYRDPFQKPVSTVP